MKQLKRQFELFSIILLAFLFLMPTAIAGVVTPAQLVFTLAPGEERCEKVTIASQSSLITLTDFWSPNKNDDNGDLRIYTASASVHGIHIRYDNELSTQERTVEICLSGENYGKYEGVLYLQEAQQSNTVLRMAVRMKVKIVDADHPAGATALISTSMGGSGGGGASAEVQTAPVSPTNTAEESDQTEETTLVDEENSWSSWITGGVIGVGKQSAFYAGIGIAGVIVASVIVFVYGKRKRDGFDEFYVR